MELLKYVTFVRKKSLIKPGNSNFQDLINAPRTYMNIIRQNRDVARCFALSINVF